MYRIALSDQFRGVSPHEIRAKWKWWEVMEAHDVLDAFEVARGSS